MLEDLVPVGDFHMPPTITPPFVVAVSTWIKTACSSVFQALVIDEYIEMWAGSNCRPVRCQSEPRLGGLLRLETAGFDGESLMIQGVFTHLDRDKVVAYTLASKNSQLPPHHIVFTLNSENGGTHLSLLHLSLGTQNDAARLTSEWEAALARLSSLFEALAGHSVDRSGASAN